MKTKKPNLGGLLLGVFFYVWCLRDLSSCHCVSWQPCTTWLELRNTRDVQTVQGKKGFIYEVTYQITFACKVTNIRFF